MADVAFLTERMRLGFGVDLSVDQVAAGLAGLGHRVTVYANFDDGTYAGRPYRLERLSVPAFPYAPLQDVLARWRAHRVRLAERAHDVFIVETPPFFSLVPTFADRAIVVDYGVSDTRGFPLLVRANFAYVRLVQRAWYFRRAARILPISRWLYDQLPPRQRARAATMPLGADHYPVPAPEDCRAMRKRLGIADDEVMLLYVGRLNPAGQPYKGTGELMAAYAELHRQLPRARLVMAGVGSDEDAARVRRAGAIPLTHAPVEDMPALHGAADVYVTASKWEGFDLPAVEAQRAGTPVVAYRVGAHHEVVDDGCSGLLVATPDAFAGALRRLVADDAYREALAARAPASAARFPWAGTVAGYDEIVRQLLAERELR